MSDFSCGETKVPNDRKAFLWLEKAISVGFWSPASRFAASYKASHVRYVPCHPHLPMV